MNTRLPDAAASPSLNSELEDLLGRAREGLALDRASALLLSEQPPLPELLSAASQIRARGKGTVVTFSKKVFIPLTTLCRDYCSYCTFRKDPGHPEARNFLRKQGFARTLDYLGAVSELVLEKTGLLPHANPGVMDRAALERLKDSNASVGLMLENVSSRLMREGLPHANAPDKVPALRLRTMEEAGKLSIAFTTGILIGIGETMEERIDSLFAIRTLHEKYGHIQEVIIQNFRAKPDIPMAAHPEPSLEDMLRTIALARLILGPQMNVQAPPNLSYEDFPRLLDAGINDWGGISPVTKDFINPEAAWPQFSRLQSETESRGFTLRERLALYPEFVGRDNFLSARVRCRIDAIVDADGYPRSVGVAAGI